METSYRKISETQAEIVTPQPDKVEKVTIDQLTEKKNRITQQLNATTQLVARYQQQLKDLDARITAINALGVKSEVLLANEVQEENKSNG